jgi:hypothetical protein
MACGSEVSGVDGGMGPDSASIEDAPDGWTAPVDATATETGNTEGGPAVAPDGANGTADTSLELDGVGGADASSSIDVTVAEPADSGKLDAAGDTVVVERPDEGTAEATDAETSAVAEGEAPTDAVETVEDSTDAAPAAEAAPDAASPPSAGFICASPCGAGGMLCAGQCESATDPNFGCNDGCFPCHFPLATAACVANECAIGECEPGWADLDGLADNGCEADVTGAGACTAARLNCAAVGELCAPTGCVATCPPPLTNCNGTCADLSTSTENCGACSNSCDHFDYGVATCSNGVCGTCPEGLSLCDGECTDTTSDPQNCGACGNACPVEVYDEQISLSEKPVAVNPICEGSLCINGCSPGLTLCQECSVPPDFKFCDQECVVTATDVNNCGACNRECATGQACVQGACVPGTSLWIGTGLISPDGIAIDTDTAYFTDPGAGIVGSVPKAGGAIVVLATVQTEPASIAIDDTFVYWAAANEVWRIQKVPSDTPHAVASVSTSVVSIAVDASFVYMLTGGVVDRAPKDGSGSAEQFSQNNTIIFGQTVTSNFSAMGYDGTSLYTLGFSSANPSQYIWNIDLSTGLAVEFSEVHGMLMLAVGYGWVAGQAGSTPANEILWTTPTMTNYGVAIPIYATVRTIAAAPCGFVWAGSGYMLNSPVNEGNKPASPGPTGLVVSSIGASVEATVVASALPNQIVVDADNTVYWTDQSGAIGKAALP